jgi:ribosomal protein S18 acetylase RimI-like enzyme
MGSVIREARGEADLADVRTLFREYVAWLGVDLTFQNFDGEVASLPGKYAPPGGELFLARRDDGHLLGCIGIRPFDRPGACEVKRLYVRKEARGSGLGRALASATIDFAAAAGYREILLDTLPAMIPAVSMYRSLGFEQTPPYWNNIIPGAMYFRKLLD